MKKITLIAFSALALAVACNRAEVEGLNPEQPQGKYVLNEITATLPDAETKTGLNTSTMVVNWSSGDRIMVIGSSGTKQQYVLDAGANTAIGKFVPVSTPVSFDDASDLRAVYPACAVAGDVAGSSIPLRINSDRSLDFSSFGITSWNKDSQFAFNINDLKVATGTGTGSNGAGVNFKFTQLATVCDFTFDFTTADKFASDYGLGDVVKSITIDGASGISGNATWNGSSLSAGDANSITWEFNSPASMTSPITKRVVMYPQVKTSNTLRIVVVTDRHTFTFTGKPTQNFTSGLYLQFPISVDSNFIEDGTTLAYTVVDKPANPLYYYGNANCYLKPSAGGSSQTFDIDITPHSTDAVYHNYSVYTSGDASAAPAANGHDVIWAETGLTITINSRSASALNVTVSGNGNGVVAIKKDSKILWSYHIWVPTETPSELSYPVTNSYDTYQLMNMPLGATKSVTAASSDADKILGAGLYYQWGRKDPLGRNAAASGGDLLTTSPLDLKTTANEVWFTTGKSGSLEDEYATYEGSTSDDPVKSITRWMIDKTIENPAMFIMTDGGANDWAGVKDDNLWGNFHSDYPKQSKLYKSIFDPCPAGYRVAPRDTWVNFTKTHANSSNAADFNISGSFAKGWTFYYEDWQTGETDFYVASGFRGRTSGSLGNVGSSGYCWSSAPSGTNGGSLGFNASNVGPLNGSNRAFGFPVRCVKE